MGYLDSHPEVALAIIGALLALLTYSEALPFIKKLPGNGLAEQLILKAKQLLSKRAKEEVAKIEEKK